MPSWVKHQRETNHFLTFIVVNLPSTMTHVRLVGGAGWSFQPSSLQASYWGWTGGLTDFRARTSKRKNLYTRLNVLPFTVVTGLHGWCHWESPPSKQVWLCIGIRKGYAFIHSIWKAHSFHKAALNYDRKDGKLTTSSGRLLQKSEADTKKEDWKGAVLPNETWTVWGWWVLGLGWGGEE